MHDLKLVGAVPLSSVAIENRDVSALDVGEAWIELIRDIVEIELEAFAKKGDACDCECGDGCGDGCGDEDGRNTGV